MNTCQVTIIVGFLGSGKTTLLKHIASLYQEEKIAIIVNEFGEKNLDIKRLERHFKNTFEVTGGSIFCSCKSDQFIEKIMECWTQGFTHIFVEGSGLANPSSLPHILSILEEKTNKEITFKGSITLVDPRNISKLTQTLNAAKNQLTYADLILLNKIDLSSEDMIKEAMETIKDFNKDAPIIPTLYSVLKKEQIESLKKTSHKADYIQTMDMHLQKVTLTFENPSKEDIKNLCEEISSKTNRIKGIFSSEGKSYYTEYIDDALKLEEINYTGENYLICLSTKKDYLKKELEEILKKSKHHFSVCSLS